MIDLFQNSPFAFTAMLFLLGLIIGSFLNVVIYRYPIILKKQWCSECCEFLSEENNNFETPCLDYQDEKKYNLSTPSSNCPHCEHKIKFYENIPLLSWILLKGRCSSCNNPISIRYPLIELLTAALSVVVGYYFGFNPITAFLLVLTWSLIALSMIDYDTKLLPDDIVLPVLWLGLLVSLFDFSLVDTENALIAVIAAYSALWLMNKLFLLITGKEGMGYGDFKLLALLGAWMGWQMLPLILILSSLAGAVIGLSLQLFFNREKSRPIPFGPYLAIAGFIALIWGQWLIQQYFEYIGMQ